MSHYDWRKTKIEFSIVHDPEYEVNEEEMKEFARKLEEKDTIDFVEVAKTEPIRTEADQK